MATKGKTGYWLFKQEPADYSYFDLTRDGRTVWDGVSNALALRHLSRVRHGDRVYFYHTGKDRAVVGEMVVVGVNSAEDDPKTVKVAVAPVRRLDSPVTLARIKADAMLKEWELVRLPRLSVIPMTAEQWRRVEQLSKEVTDSETTT
jgi:predicted RNA-binding protein with PUA-like domain